MESSVIDAAYRAGSAAFPGLSLDPARFGEFVRARAEDWEGRTERAADLFLACACAAHVPGASERFFAWIGPRLGPWLGRLGQRAEVVDEVRQILAVRCLLGENGHPPAIGTYTGRGSLEGWVRATATREALAIVKREARSVAREEDEAPLEIFATDEEIAALKRVYREPVLRAFGVAGGQLGPEHRLLLRLHYVEGVTTARLAEMHGVGRATIVRRLTEAREALVDGVRAELSRAAGVIPDDLESVLRLVRSQMDLRLSLLLASRSAI